MFFLYVHRSCCFDFSICSIFLTKLLFCKCCPPLNYLFGYDSLDVAFKLNALLLLRLVRISSLFG